jgi:hypothetical protein
MVIQSTEICLGIHCIVRSAVLDQRDTPFHMKRVLVPDKGAGDGVGRSPISKESGGQVVT